MIQFKRFPKSMYAYSIDYWVHFEWPLACRLRNCLLSLFVVIVLLFAFFFFLFISYPYTCVCFHIWFYYISYGFQCVLCFLFLFFQLNVFCFNFDVVSFISCLPQTHTYTVLQSLIQAITIKIKRNNNNTTNRENFNM